MLFPEVRSLWLFAGMLALDGCRIGLAAAAAEYLTRIRRETGKRHHHFHFAIQLAGWFCAPVARAGKAAIVSVTPSRRANSSSKEAWGSEPTSDSNTTSAPPEADANVVVVTTAGSDSSGVADASNCDGVKVQGSQLDSEAARGRWDKAAWRVKAVHAAARPDNMNAQERLLMVTLALRLLVSMLSALLVPVWITLGR